MALRTQTKTFAADTAVATDAAANTFLQTLDQKDVLDVLATADASGKYGHQKTFVVTVVYTELIP